MADRYDFKELSKACALGAARKTHNNLLLATQS
jgi:hypothetical protein